MAEPRINRRLAAILAADVVGYSRLIRENEEATLAALERVRAEVLVPAIAARKGRVFKLVGDGLLAEFPSVVEAVRAAATIQEAMPGQHADPANGPRLTFRIGINLGDVVVDGDDLQGDGVNVAARLEGEAEPGGICIADAVYEQVRDRINLPFEDRGDVTVKNIARPIRVWHWAGKPTVSPDATANNRPAQPNLAQPERPSLAVLPFANLSGDPEQDYFADAMAEEIIAGLARIRWLTLIARNSSFAYKGSSPDIRSVGQDLGVRYVIQGSVRKAGNSIRIIAQLSDADSRAQLWADRFTGTLHDVFDLQDQITAGVVAAIEPSVRQAEIDRAKRKRPDSLDAYDLYLRALEQSYIYTPAARNAGLALLDAAIALEPHYAEAHGVAAYCRQQRYLWGGRAPEDRAAALSHAEAVSASRTDDSASLAFAAMALSALDGRHEIADAMLERALTHNPSSSTAHMVSALVGAMTGDGEAAEIHANRSLALNPFDPLRHVQESILSTVKLARGEAEAALQHAHRAIQANPGFTPGLTSLALCLVALGRIEEARATVDRVLDIAPDTRLATMAERYLSANLIGIEQLVHDLRLAGMPD